MACDSWFRGGEFEPHLGCKDYLKVKKSLKENATTFIKIQIVKAYKMEMCSLMNYSGNTSVTNIQTKK